MNRIAHIVLPALTLLPAAPAALAITVPYTEAFTSGNANWTNAANAPLDAIPTGGPDNSPYASTTFNFAGTNPQSTPAVLRAQSTTNASGGNFFGDWITSNATVLTFDFRHDASAPLDTFVRWTGAGSPPAPGLILFGPAVQPNTWTNISLPVSALSPFFPEPGANFNAIFSQVVRMQFGVTPGALAGVNTTVHFDIDNVTITPTPGAAALLSPLALTALRRRR